MAKERAGALLERRLVVTIFVVCCYGILSLLAFWPVDPFSTSRIVDCGCYDVAEQVWFLAWVPHAILHGLNPFSTVDLNAPFGANLAANTTMPLLGVLGSPITLVLGPTATYNVLVRLAFALSAIALYALARRLGCRCFPAFAGGLAYGFSPYMVAEGSVHLDLVFVALPPLVFLVVHDLVVRRRHAPWRDGLLLGVLVTAQYLISAEICADLLVLLVLGLVIAAVRSPGETRRIWRHVAAGLVPAVVTFVAVAGYPIAYLFLGAQHVVGSPFDRATVDIYSSDLLSPIVPTNAMLVGPESLRAIGSSYTAGSTYENGGYLSVTLVAATVATAVLVRRPRAVRLAAMMALVAFVLSLGPFLVIDNHATAIWLPFRALAALPGFAFDVPARFSAFEDLFVALVLALGIDHLAGFVARRSAAHFASAPEREGAPAPEREGAREGVRAGAGVVAGRASLRGEVLAFICALGAAAVALVPLAPRLPFASAKVGIPTYFTSKAVHAIRPGAIVLAYPYPMNPTDQAMLWQEASGFRFRIIGGYVLTPFETSSEDGAGPGGGFAPRTLDPPLVEILFEDAYGGVGKGVVPPPPLPWAFAEARALIDRYRVDDIVVGMLGADPSLVVRFFTAMLGRGPVHSGGVDVWYNVRRSPGP